jgi:hypothetical protein
MALDARLKGANFAKYKKPADQAPWRNPTDILAERGAAWDASTWPFAGRAIICHAHTEVHKGPKFIF